MTTYLFAYWQDQRKKLKYWELRQTRQENKKSKTFYIQYLGNNEKVIRWINQQAAAGRIRWNEAAAMIRKIEGDKFAAYFHLGSRWQDLKALGYDPRSDKKRGLHLPADKGKSTPSKDSEGDSVGRCLQG